MDVTFRPIGGDWPEELAAIRKPSPFKADYMDSEKLLRYEVDKLDGDLLVVQVALDEMDLKVDGRPKMRAEYRHPGVIVSFESRHGPLRYATDVFDDWRANLRAVALGLEALRKVDRYGISRRGEQYTGWRALEAGGSEPEIISTREQAARFLSEHGGIVVTADNTSPSAVGRAYRRAATKLHPDAGGDPGQFERLQEARDMLAGQSPSAGAS